MTIIEMFDFITLSQLESLAIEFYVCSASGPRRGLTVVILNWCMRQGQIQHLHARLEELIHDQS